MDTLGSGGSPPRGVSTRSQLLSPPSQTASNSQGKSAAVAASRDQLGCWWLIIALAGRNLGQAAAMTSSQILNGTEVWRRSPQELGPTVAYHLLMLDVILFEM